MRGVNFREILENEIFLFSLDHTRIFSWFSVFTFLVMDFTILYSSTVVRVKGLSTQKINGRRTIYSGNVNI